MPEDVRQSTESQSFNADRTNNLVGNLVRKPIPQYETNDFYNKEMVNVSNDFTKVKEDKKAEFVEFI